jgi:hypothetical protein
MKALRVALIVVFATLVHSCGERNTEYVQKAANPEFLHRSVAAVTDRIVHDIFSPPVASRIYAYSSVAAFEALVPSDSSLMTLAGQLNGLTPVPQPESGQAYCFPLASVKALLKVGRALIFSESDLDEYHDQIMAEYKATGIPDDVFDRSVAYGELVADHILKWADQDTYKQSRSFPKYSISSDPSTWKPTPPAYMDAVEPHWNKIRTLAIDSSGQFKPAPPIPFSTSGASDFFKEAKEVHVVGKELSEEQKTIAAFWDCNPFVMNVRGHVMFATKKISPGGHWMNITRVACEQSNSDFVSSAEAYLRVSVSLFDAFISCWDEKYRSRLIRPETYINQYIDKDWVPFLQTPPFPEYTSGHSTISASAAVALTGLFGDNYAFTDSTEVQYGMTVRSFPSFFKAAEEASISRLYGGIHYRRATEQGLITGRAIGEFILNRLKTRKKPA